MAQDPIQALKLEISKQTRLEPYERITFHRILGILRTENGMRVLLRELKNQQLVRESAIITLIDFNFDEVRDAFIKLLKEDISQREKIYVLTHLEKYGISENVPDIIEFINANRENPENYPVLSRAFNVLRSLGADSAEVEDFLVSIAVNPELDDVLRALAIVAFAYSPEVVSPGGTTNDLTLKPVSLRTVSALPPWREKTFASLIILQVPERLLCLIFSPSLSSKA